MIFRMLASLFIAATLCGPAFADALEGKKSPAEILGETTSDDWRTIPQDELLVIELERGKVVVALSPSLAPNHVRQLRTLTRSKFYDGLSFYRVIDGFVAQGGDAFGEKEIGDAKKELTAEFEVPMKNANFTPLPDVDGFAPQSGFLESLPAGHDPESGAYWGIHCTGAFAFGRGDGPDTASTEFYVALQPQRYLDRNMSVFGRVIEGMPLLQAMRRVDPPQSKDDDLGEKILSMRFMADLPKEERADYEILDSARPAFVALAEARRNRPESFFHFRPNHLDICQFPVPVRLKAAE